MRESASESRGHQDSSLIANPYIQLSRFIPTGTNSFPSVLPLGQAVLVPPQLSQLLSTVEWPLDLLTDAWTHKYDGSFSDSPVALSITHINYSAHQLSPTLHINLVYVLPCKLTTESKVSPNISDIVSINWSWFVMWYIWAPSKS